MFFIAAGSLFSFSSGSCCIAFHSTLEERQKDIVRLILDSLSGYEYEIKLPFSISPDEAETIVDHVLTDYPELFYVGDEYYYTQTGESAPVSAITFTPRMPRRQAERIWKQMMSRTAPLLSSLEGKSDYQKARLVHDWLAENVSYSLDSTSDYTPYGAILRGKAACEGYAEAYTLLLRQLGVSASVVGGTGVTADGSEAHAWNIVRINDEYVLVDVTWDDEEESDRISHIYFALKTFYVVLSEERRAERRSHRGGITTGENAHKVEFPAVGGDFFARSAEVAVADYSKSYHISSCLP